MTQPGDNTVRTRERKVQYQYHTNGSGCTKGFKLLEEKKIRLPDEKARKLARHFSPVTHKSKKYRGYFRKSLWQTRPYRKCTSNDRGKITSGPYPELCRGYSNVSPVSPLIPHKQPAQSTNFQRTVGEEIEAMPMPTSALLVTDEARYY